MSLLCTIPTFRFSVLATADGENSLKELSSNGANKPKLGVKSTLQSSTSDQPTQKKLEPLSTRSWTEELQTDLDRILSVGEECVTPDELRQLLLRKGRDSSNHHNNNTIVFYDGFEPSGRMHIAQGVFKAMNVNKCVAAGTNATFVFWVADWFALMNDKMGGDLEKIQTVGYYLIEVWKAAGMDLTNVVFKWASQEITKHANTYWPIMLDVASRFNITRIKKCCQIMGRLENSLTAAQVLYPLMQCTDVFFLKADICQLGVDQRKVNMLAREYCDAASIKHKPIILSHHMLYGLKAGQEKMSKSDPDSAIFMEDTVPDVERKILAAYCPIAASEVTEMTTHKDDSQSMHLIADSLKNPCLDYIQHIIFSPPDATFTAGSCTFGDFDAVQKAFLSNNLSEQDLKHGLITELNRLLDPVRHHFESDSRAKELLTLVRQYKNDSSSSKTIRRLNLVELGKIPAQAHLVFAPLPTSSPSLQQAMDILTRLRLNTSNEPSILFLPDWSARVCSSCDRDVKAITAVYVVLISALKVVDETTMGNVQIIWQSECILADPSNYWISVINIGRHFMLQKLMGHWKDHDSVGNVIARLMLVADVVGVEPKTLAMECDCTVEADLITEFYDTQLPDLTAPNIQLMDAVSFRLQSERLIASDNDEYYLLDDPKVHGKSKLKKAFCEPGNVDFCPPLTLAGAFGFSHDKTFTIHRSADNGGDLQYRDIAHLQNDFANNVLHPGDLKAAVAEVMVSVLEQIAVARKSDTDVVKAMKTLQNFQKKKH